MTMWIIIMYIMLMATAMSLVYLSWRVGKFNFVRVIAGNKRRKRIFLGVFIVFGLFFLISIWLDLINAIVCAVYFAMIWGACDIVFTVMEKWRAKSFKAYYAGGWAFFLAVAALTCGWYLNHNVWQTTYELISAKNVKLVKIALFADSHLGTTFKAEGFAKHIAAIQAQNPDMLIVAGDFVDDGTSKKDMIEASKILGNVKTKYGVYFVFGNHDKGYYGSAYRGFSSKDLVDELEKNGVVVLRDEAQLVDDAFYVIGRRDLSEVKEKNGSRQSMEQIVSGIDKNKYLIVVDHQPADYNNQTKSEVDLVLSGHTHGGQLFPFNQVGKWIGANDMVYGHEKRRNTDFIVTSGLSDWAIKFKTGTKSEFVIINVQPKNQ